MKIYDIIILIILILFAIVGFKRGFFKSLVSFIGFILVVALAYSFKNIIGDFLTLNLPFVKFNQFLGGATSLNVLMYQAIAFIVVLAILSLVYKIIVTITGIFEKILKLTIILGIPSKILGLVFGLLEGYIIIYLVLFFIAQPFIDINLFDNSDYAKGILEKTPVLSSYGEKSVEIFNEINALTDKENAQDIDLELANIIIKENITSKDVMQKLVDKGKINKDIQEVIDKY